MGGVRRGLEGLVGSDMPFRGDLRTSQKGFFFFLNSLSSNEGSHLRWKILFMFWFEV